MKKGYDTYDNRRQGNDSNLGLFRDATDSLLLPSIESNTYALRPFDFISNKSLNVKQPAKKIVAPKQESDYFDIKQSRESLIKANMPVLKFYALKEIARRKHEHSIISTNRYTNNTKAVADLY